MKAKFKVGDRVVCKADPEARGTVTDVVIDEDGYDDVMLEIKLGVGSTFEEQDDWKKSRK